MSGPEEDTDKSHEPTQNKLSEARKKGEIARSADLLTAASYCGMFLVLIAYGDQLIQNTGSTLMVFLQPPGDLLSLSFTTGVSDLGVALTSFFSPGFIFWLLAPGLAALLAAIAQQSLIFTPEKLKPKLDRLNPIKNAKQKYGRSGLFEFSKSFAKLIIYSTLLVLYLVERSPDITGAIHSKPSVVGLLMALQVVEFLFVVIAVSLTIGAVDYFWQRYDHLQRHRMSHREVKDEHKQQEGDPHFKQERQRRAAQVVANQIATEVPKADVVIMNPTHFAVALKWSRLPGSAPECIAKGKDHLALKIREIAEENGIPVCADPPTARALFATMEVGEEINPKYYRAVAAAIRFAQTMQEKASARR